MQKARSHSPYCYRKLLPLVSARFQFFFTLLSEVIFTFPSRYSFAIGLSVVFSLARWSSRIPTGFLVSRGTQDTARSIKYYMYGTITLCGSIFQKYSISILYLLSQSYNPDVALLQNRFGLFPFRSPLLRESLLFSLPPGT